MPRRNGSGSRSGSWRIGLGAAVVTAVVGASSVGWALADAPSETYVSAAEARLTADVSYLADDAREGRGAGTKGLDDAAAYIAEQFREIGLTPAPGAEAYFQPFEIPGDAQLKGEPCLSFHGPDGATIDVDEAADVTPLQRGGGGELKDVPIVFAGYGITAKNDELKLDYDDYRDLDVKGKAVLILRQEPQVDKADSPFAGTETTSYATLRHKARNAAERGAAAVLFVNNAASVKEKEGKDERIEFGMSDGDGTGPPFVMISRALADRLLQAAGAPCLAELEAQIDGDLAPRSRALDGWALQASIPITREPYQIKNVVGVLEGSGPLAEETIVVGAHYDHVGLGGKGSLAPGRREVHNGADDNASGTALMMEMARRLARRVDPLPRRVVFIAFSGEERGLFGSRHYVKEPLFPLEQTVAMFNFDMVGRLGEDDELTIFGAPTLDGLDELTSKLAASQGIEAKIVRDTSREFNASDHAPFYQKDIPIFFAFTGTHADYHRPSDDTERIDFEGMRRIADMCELLLLDVARRPQRPTFAKLAAPAPGAGSGKTLSQGQGAYLGTRPSYGETDVKGVKLDGVTEESPAAKAGLKEGDVITRLNAKTIGNVEDFMEALSSCKPGETVEVGYQRDGKDESVKATLGVRPAAN